MLARMRLPICMAVLLLGAALGTAADTAPPPAPAARPLAAALITVHGEVDEVMAAIFQRQVDQALAGGAELLVLDLDTWGGGLHPAYEMTDTLLHLPPHVRTIAFVSRKAISAGAMLALACNAIAMAPNTRLGDCEPILVAGGEIRTGPEKIISPLRSDFRNFAERNGYPEALAVAMVDKQHEVLRVRLAPEGLDLSDEQQRARAAERAEVVYVQASELEQWPPDKRFRVLERETVVREGELLTLNHTRAQEYGFARWIARDLDELVGLLAAEYGRPLALARLELGPWEAFVRFLTGPMHGFLMFVGVLGLMIEFYHPGLIVPGAVGLACLALAFFGSHLLGLVGVVDVLLLVVGVGLLLVELLVLPGFGLAGVLGLLSVAAGLLLMRQPFVVPESPLEMEQFLDNLKGFGLGLAALVLLFAAIVRLLPKSPWLSQLVLQGSQRVENGYSVASPARVALIGRVGRALTPLRPAGKVELGEEVVDAVAEGEMLDPGTEVEIIDTDANRVLVRRHGGGSAGGESQA
ncbi:MAG: hypothetical protein KatS3mg102_1026 [Planctomycetota bacterium]|nr:MAG: hypothetical protein KatS3mg102_1026 [Planctomycetota bacterium]